jgi:hypothetical protein
MDSTIDWCARVVAGTGETHGNNCAEEARRNCGGPQDPEKHLLAHIASFPDPDRH